MWSVIGKSVAPLINVLKLAGQILPGHYSGRTNRLLILLYDWIISVLVVNPSYLIKNKKYL